MNLKLIIKYYWPHLKRYKKSALLAFFSYGLGVVGGGIITPLLYKRIIDIVSTAGNPALVGDAIRAACKRAGELGMRANERATG